MSSGEFDFIEDLQKQFSINSFNELGIGDDCAVFPANDLESYLVSTDLLCEEVHFSFDFMTWKELGWKSIAVNLSDIAAMGGKAKYIFISLAIPKDYFHSNLLKEYYSGVHEICDTYHVSVMGGDTSSSQKHLFLSITAIGIAENNKVLYRSGAKPGDYIYVTGNIGDSSFGLDLLLNNKDHQYQEYFKKKHIKSFPRLKEMEYLNNNFNLTSAIDLSDGLASDLHHILKESRVGAEIFWEKLPFSEELLYSLNRNFDSIKQFALKGGEDYEVLFTTRDQIEESKLQSLGLPLSYIGRINSKPFKAYLRKDNQNYILEAEGFDHFI